MTKLFTVESPELFFTGGIGIGIEEPLSVESGITALVGDNGSGKSLFAKIIEKGWNYRTNVIKSPSGKKPLIKYLEFNDVHSWIGNSVGYYQQRYEAAMNDEVPIVADIMGARITIPQFQKLTEKFNLQGAGTKKINFLSSGELRKILIINALLDSPELLILDNPYIGLDADSRIALNEAIRTLRNEGLSVMLILSDEKDIPEFTDNVLYAYDLTISGDKARNETVQEIESENLPLTRVSENCNEEILSMEDCHVHYGNIKVLDNINWNIKSGQRWSLSGPNGSGKSTLLSLIYADNPKCYNNNLRLFGERRGTGESIWDIKKRIGYVSPEMQLHFHGDGTIREIVAAGLNDTVGLYVKPTEEQLRKADAWLRFFALTYLAERTYNTLSSGERQLVLVIRAMIKEPDLLILDEPMHALDPKNKKKVEAAINGFLENNPSSSFIMVTHNPEELPETINNHLTLNQNAT